MKYLVYGIFDKDENDLPVQEVDANSSAEAKLLAAAQAGGYWSGSTEAVCPERLAEWQIVNRVIERKAAIIATQAAEIARLRSALKEGERICDGLRSDADQLGELIFGDYAEDDPTGNGNERYDWAEAHGIGLNTGELKELARRINAMLDSEWVDVDGSRQAVPANVSEQVQGNWQPVPDETTIPCACSTACEDKLIVRSGRSIQIINPALCRSADIILPNTVRLCVTQAATE